MSVQSYEGAKNLGLEGVVACSSALSSIVGMTLCYRGYKIEDLAEKACFEEVIYLLWNGKKPSSDELKSFQAELCSEFELSSEYQSHFTALAKSFPKEGHPMDFVKTLVSLDSFFDPDVSSNSEEANRRKAMRLTAKMGVLVANFERIRQGKDFLAPKKDKSIAWNFLYMLNGPEEPKAEWVDIFDKALTLHADHGLNCSTFSTRVTVSSLSDLHSGIVAAIGTLKGPLHGGANTAVMEMLKEIGSPEKIESFVEDCFAQKKKIMGIGHRVYKEGDPRAKILRVFSEKLCKETNTEELFEMSSKIEEIVREKKGLLPNVDFYSATVYNAMGIPGDLFTPIFTVSRVVGWCAHAIEQYEGNRIYRPRLEYTGAKDLSW